MKTDSKEREAHRLMGNMSFLGVENFGDEIRGIWEINQELGNHTEE